MGLGPQEIVEKVKALSPVRSRRRRRRTTRTLVNGLLLLLRFTDTLPIRAAPALLVELSRVSLLHRVPVQAIRALLVQPTAHLRPPPRLAEFRAAVLPVNVPAHARHAGRVRGGLLVTRRLAS